jgi:indoleamine 2,3-dioxygenase
MANTKYPKATGGTPIISWLPNQIKAVMKEMRHIIKIIGDLNLNIASKEFSLYEKIKLSLNKKEKLLEEQLSLVNKKIFLAEEVFDLNKKYDLKDN